VLRENPHTFAGIRVQNIVESSETLGIPDNDRNHAVLSTCFFCDDFHCDGSKSIQFFITGLGEQRLCPQMLGAGCITFQQSAEKRDERNAFQRGTAITLHLLGIRPLQ
jgi:hypothetical protein